MAQRRARR